jgi:CHAT domain-containing protein/tetratricopeptide (TPR) repeat protein
MNRLALIEKQKGLKDSFIFQSLISILFLLLVLTLVHGCAVSKMSSEEARRVSLSTSKKNIEPPPRKIGDIFVGLDKDEDDSSSKFRQYKKLYESSPPKSADKADLVDYHFQRARIACQVGDMNNCLKEMRIAYDYKKGSSAFGDNFLIFKAGVEENAGGNYKEAVETYKRISGLYPKKCLVESYLWYGDFENAEKSANEAEYIYNSGSSSPFQRYLMAYIKGMMLESKGKLDDAENAWAQALSLIEPLKQKETFNYYRAKKHYIYNLLAQSKLTVAEIEAREFIKDMAAIVGKKSSLFSHSLLFYSDILREQARVQEAEILVNEALKIRDSWNMDLDISAPDFYRALMDILCAQNEFEKAIGAYDASQKSFDDEGYIFLRSFGYNHNLPLALIFCERIEEAKGQIERLHKAYVENYGKSHIKTCEIRLLRGISNLKSGLYTEGYQDYRDSIDVYLSGKNDHEKSFSTKQRFRQILEAYLSFFSNLHKTKHESEFSIDASLEAFKIVEVLRQQSVQQALAASASRIAVKNVELSLMVRQEQDNGRMIAVLDRMLLNHVSMPTDQQDPKVVEDLKVQIASLTEARSTIIIEIKQKFPDYENLINPKPADYQTVARFLRAHETLLSIYPSTERSYVWSIDEKGKVDFAVLPAGSKQVGVSVQDLRRSLDLNCEKLGEIPEFDLKLSYWFYQTFLEPVKASWSGQKDLLIVADGPLGALPFSVLTTQPYRLSQSSDLLFSEYRKAPWLVRQVSITRIPSVSALIGLRSLPPGDPNRKSFIGFGDPIFNKAQVQALKPADLSAAMAKRGAQFQIRGVRVTQQGALDRANIVSNRLSMLNRLPDTAEEVISVSQSVKADREQDVFLGPKATEQMVRSLDLSNRRVVYFATHALVPGDIDGLHEPALALCAPEVAGGEEDGLLTAGEIMTLKLNADWVILSACNTAAAAGEGAEAISGLGRAFFYAGTRALLVSMWPVETSSARELTTRLFGIQNENPNLSRSGALRESMVQLIDGPGMVDKTSGKTIASYAHPFFWAPFIIVGDN